MHNKIHSVISPLFRIKNADTETGWNVQILRSVWIISAEIRYLLSGQKKFQNKSKNIDEVYQSVFFRCIMFLSYRVTFLCNVLGQIHYTSESPVRYFFYEKVVKWCFSYICSFIHTFYFPKFFFYLPCNCFHFFLSYFPTIIVTSKKSEPYLNSMFPSYLFTIYLTLSSPHPCPFKSSLSVINLPFTT